MSLIHLPVGVKFFPGPAALLVPTRFPSLLRCWWTPWSGSVPLCAVRASLETLLLVRSAPFGSLGLVGAWLGGRLDLRLLLAVALCLAVCATGRWLGPAECVDLGSCPPFMS